MKILRRTFAAKNYPKGSEERARLNEMSATSEYMPSYKYVVIEDHETAATGGLRSFRTKREAEEFVKSRAIHFPRI